MANNPSAVTDQDKAKKALKLILDEVAATEKTFRSNWVILKNFCEAQIKLLRKQTKNMLEVQFYVAMKLAAEKVIQGSLIAQKQAGKMVQENNSDKLNIANLNLALEQIAKRSIPRYLNAVILQMQFNQQSPDFMNRVSSAFNQFQLKNYPREALNFTDRFVTATQRSPRYVLLAKEIAKQCKIIDPNLALSTASLESAVTRINASLSEIDNAMQIRKAFSKDQPKVKVQKISITQKPSENLCKVIQNALNKISKQFIIKFSRRGYIVQDATGRNLFQINYKREIFGRRQFVTIKPAVDPKLTSSKISPQHYVAAMALTAGIISNATNSHSMSVQSKKEFAKPIFDNVNQIAPKVHFDARTKRNFKEEINGAKKVAEKPKQISKIQSDVIKGEVFRAEPLTFQAPKKLHEITPNIRVSALDREIAFIAAIDSLKKLYVKVTDSSKKQSSMDVYRNAQLLQNVTEDILNKFVKKNAPYKIDIEIKGTQPYTASAIIHAYNEKYNIPTKRRTLK